MVRWRLFREACCPYEGNYVKDLLCLGRPLQDAIIVDNSPHSYVFQPDNALPIGNFIDDPTDRCAHAAGSQVTFCDCSFGRRGNACEPMEASQATTLLPPVMDAL